MIWISIVFILCLTWDVDMTAGGAVQFAYFTHDALL